MKMTIGVGGMSCMHCVERVKKAIQEVRGVKDVEVDLKAGKVHMDIEDDEALRAIKDAIREAGYTTS